MDADRIKIVVQQSEYNREKDMNIAHTAFVWLIVSFLFVSGSPLIAAITIDELAGICEKMESSIADISLEYNWYVVPPWTIEESEKEMGIPTLAVINGLNKCKLSAAGLSPKDTNTPVPRRILTEVASTVIDKDGHSWYAVLKKSYDGKVIKLLSTGGFPEPVPDGEIVRGEDFTKYMGSIVLTPIGFSVLRFKTDKVVDNKPLSSVLRHDKELVRLDNAIQKVNDFNTVRVDLLQESTKQVCIRVYFSVDHGYTPVRYEYVETTKAGTIKVGMTVDIQSLEKVAEELWFPSSGSISVSDSKHINKFVATSKIAVNQGPTDKQFDIDFPVGTRVYDTINGRRYVVKPAGE